MSTLRALWRGEVPLVTAWWVWNVLVGNLLIGQGGASLVGAIGSLFLAIVYIALASIFSVFLLVAIWRSANNYKGSKFWAVIAKALCVIGVLGGAWQLLELFNT